MKILKRLYLNPFNIVLITISLASYASGQSTRVPAMPQRPQGGGPTASAQGMPQASRMQPTNLEANGGSMANGVYTNKIYGFSMKTPPGWAVLPSKDPVPANAEDDNPALKSAQISHTLLAATENAPLRKSSERKSLQIIATHMVGGQLTPKSAEDYLIYSRNKAKEKGMAVEYLGDPEEVNINGEKLWKVATNEEIAGKTQHVEQYVIARESTLLQFFLVSPTEPGLKDIEPAIQTLQFRPLASRRAQKRKPRSAKAMTSTQDKQK